MYIKRVNIVNVSKEMDQKIYKLCINKNKLKTIHTNCVFAC